MLAQVFNRSSAVKGLAKNARTPLSLSDRVICSLVDKPLMAMIFTWGLSLWSVRTVIIVAKDGIIRSSKMTFTACLCSAYVAIASMPSLAVKER